MVQVLRWNMVVQFRSERAFSGSELLGQCLSGRIAGRYVEEIFNSLEVEAVRPFPKAIVCISALSSIEAKAERETIALAVDSLYMA